MRRRLASVARHLQRPLVRDVVPVEARGDLNRRIDPAARHRAVPLEHDHSVGDPPLAVAPLEPVDVPPAGEAELLGAVDADHADEVALGVGGVAVDVDVLGRDVALVPGERVVHVHQVPNEPVESADVLPVVLDRVGVVRRREEFGVTAVESTGIAMDAVGDRLPVEQAPQRRDLPVVQLGGLAALGHGANIRAAG